MQDCVKNHNEIPRKPYSTQLLVGLPLCIEQVTGSHPNALNHEFFAKCRLLKLSQGRFLPRRPRHESLLACLQCFTSAGEA